MANQTKPRPSLLLAKKPIEFVKPSKHTPCGNLSLSTLDNNPVNEAMYAFIYVFDANKNNQNDPVSLLRKALSELVVYYYPLAGKLMRRKNDGKFQLVCNAEGVPFAIATADRDLRSLNYIENISDDIALKLVHKVEVNFLSETGCHPLSLQVTKFPCGGITIGIAVTHALCDGSGVATIFSALIELAGGKTEPLVMPVWQRERLIGELDDQPAKVPGGDKDGLLATSPYMPSSDMVTETIKITAGNIKKLKDAVLTESLTTFEGLCAYIWKSASRALKLNLDGITVLNITVGIRNVLDPPLPSGYYGNGYIDVYIEITAGELEESSISDIVKLVQRAKKSALEKGYVEEELKNTERLMKEDAKFEGVTDGILLLTDLRNTGLFGSIDFGWNEPVNIWPLTPQEKASNLGIIMRPSKLDPSMEGGAKVVMTLPKDAMANFKKAMYDI